MEVAEPYRSKVEAMIAAYYPKDNRKTLVETKIVLRDQISVYLSSRRLAPREKSILDSQVSEWIKTDIIKLS